MKELFVGLIVFLGLILLLVLLSSSLYLFWCLTTDAGEVWDYFRHRGEYRMWKWMQSQAAAEPLEVREQRCLAELKEIREEKIRREGKRPVMRVYTFLPENPRFKRHKDAF